MLQQVNARACNNQAVLWTVLLHTLPWRGKTLAIALRIRQVIQLLSNIGLPPPVLELAQAGQVCNLA